MTPIRQRLRRISAKLLAAVNVEIDWMLADGKIRFCIEYHALNLIYNLCNARELSKIDLRQAYHQIPLELSSREFTESVLECARQLPESNGQNRLKFTYTGSKNFDQVKGN